MLNFKIILMLFCYEYEFGGKIQFEFVLKVFVEECLPLNFCSSCTAMCLEEWLKNRIASF